MSLNDLAATPLTILMQLILATAFTTRQLEPREPVVSHTICAVILFLASGFLWMEVATTLREHVDGTLVFALDVAMFVGLLALLFAAIMVCFEGSVLSALFCCCASYTTQNLMWQANTLFDILAWQTASPPESPTYALEVLVFTCVVLALCQRLFFSHADRTTIVDVQDRLVLAVLGIVVIVNITFGVACTGLEDADTPLLLKFVEGVVSAAVCGFTLFVQFEMVCHRQQEENLAALRRLHLDEARQLKIARETIEAINAKCHEIRHQIMSLDGVRDKVDPVTLGYIARRVDIYDSGIHTGSPTLDIILSEKSLVCEHHRVLLSCMADGTSLGFVEVVDLYSLFGNMFDLAIEAQDLLDDADKRQVSLSVRPTAGTISIHLEGYAAEGFRATDLDTDDRLLAMRAVVERYLGSVCVSVDDGVFKLNALMPIPASRRR